MTDARIQELQRAVAGGDRDARLPLLQELRRSGRVTVQQLELAALAWDPDARALLSDPPPDMDPGRSWVGELGTRLVRNLDTNPMLFARLAVAAAGVALEAYEKSRAVEPSVLPLRIRTRQVELARELIEMAQAWIDCPCQEHLQPTIDISGRSYEELGVSHPAFAAYTADLVAYSPNYTGQTTCGHVFAVSVRFAGEQAVRDAVRSQFVPWILGLA